jgi:hypothetical protein
MEGYQSPKMLERIELKSQAMGHITHMRSSLVPVNVLILAHLFPSDTLNRLADSIRLAAPGPGGDVWMQVGTRIAAHCRSEPARSSPVHPKRGMDQQEGSWGMRHPGLTLSCKHQAPCPESTNRRPGLYRFMSDRMYILIVDRNRLRLTFHG